MTTDRQDRRASLIPGAGYVAAVMKQERPYILEWVAWHRLLGFEIMIADNGGSDGQTELLRQLEDAGLISYVDVRHFRRAPQTLAYYAMFRRALRAGVSYLGFLDADEFFEPLSTQIEQGAGDALVRRLFADTHASVLVFNWMNFGSSALRDAGPEPVLRRFTRSAPEDFLPNHHFKSFCDVKQCARLLGTGMLSHLVLNAHGANAGILHYSHDGSDMKFHRRGFGLTDQVSWKNARIRHYTVKSLAEYRDLKAARGRASMQRAYKKDFFAENDRNEMQTPMDSRALALLSEKMREIERQLGPASHTNGWRLIEPMRVGWDARPALRLLLSKLR